VENNGNGVNIAKIKLPDNSDIYNPHALFFKMRSSTNYKKTDENGNSVEKEKFTGGMNGLGIKCTNIFSQKFQLHTVFEDQNGQKWSYTQESRNNMRQVDAPIIEKVLNSRDTFTRVKYFPDLKLFSMK
jgi:DNA gyrase/topoisomerase IV subunit B